MGYTISRLVRYTLTPLIQEGARKVFVASMQWISITGCKVSRLNVKTAVATLEVQFINLQPVNFPLRGTLGEQSDKLQLNDQADSADRASWER